MEAERIVEAVQTDAAETAAQSAASQVAIEVHSDAVAIASEVSQVADELAEHPEVTEEQHGEILEGQQWQREQFQQLQNNLTNNQSQTAALLSAMQSQLTALQQLVTQRNPNNPPSPDSTLLNQGETEPVVVVEVVEPNVDAEDPANQTRSQLPAPKRKRRLI